MTATPDPTATVDRDLVAAYGAKLLAAAAEDEPHGLEQVRGELREVFWAYGLDLDDLRVARTGLAVLRYLTERAATGRFAGDLAAALTAVATAFAEHNPQPIPAHRILHEDILQLPGEDSWWEVDWRRPGTADGLVRLRLFEARPALMGWEVLATSPNLPRTITVAADTVVTRA
jgi:hypothetical protein